MIYQVFAGEQSYLVSAADQFEALLFLGRPSIHTNQRVICQPVKDTGYSDRPTGWVKVLNYRIFEVTSLTPGFPVAWQIAARDFEEAKQLLKLYNNAASPAYKYPLQKITLRFVPTSKTAARSGVLKVEKYEETLVTPGS